MTNSLQLPQLQVHCGTHAASVLLLGCCQPAPGHARSWSQAFPAHCPTPRTGSFAQGGPISPGKNLAADECSAGSFLKPPSSSPFPEVRHSQRALSIFFCSLSKDPSLTFLSFISCMPNPNLASASQRTLPAPQKRKNHTQKVISHKITKKYV